MSTPSQALPTSALHTLAATEVRLYLRERVGLLWGVAFPLLLLLGIGSVPSAQQASPWLGGLRFIDGRMSAKQALGHHQDRGATNHPTATRE